MRPDSPVQCNAFDPELQLWVGACLYQGAVDVARSALRLGWASGPASAS